MKTVAIALAVFLVSAIVVSAQTTPSWTGFVYNHIEFGSSQDTDLTRLRVRVDRTPSKNNCNGGRVEVDLADANKSYLHQAWLACSVNGWTVKTGRLFTASTTEEPAPFVLKTAKYPTSWTYTAYAYGIQVDRTLGKGWQMSVDFTGQSGLKYNDTKHLFGRSESSGRLTRQDDVWSYGGAYQISPDFARVGLDAERRWGRLTTDVVALYTTERKHVEDFVFAEYQLTSWLKPHVQVDRAKDKTTALAGVGMCIKKYVYFVVDHDRHDFCARLHLMVSKK